MIHTSNNLSIYRYIHLSIHPSIYPFIHLSIHLSIYLSIYPSIHLSIYPSIYTIIKPSIYIHLSIHPSNHRYHDSIIDSWNSKVTTPFWRLYYDDYTQIVSFSGIRIVPVISQPTAKWNGRTGYIQVGDNLLSR